MALNPLVQFLDLYERNPVLFVREVLGAEPDPIQIEIMEAVVRGDRRISVRSGHGVGKTAVASWIVIWYILTRIHFKVILTSQSAPQLFDALFVELKMWLSKMPPALQGLLIVTSDRIELAGSPAEGFVSARTSRADSPEAMAGVHAAHVLIVGDEASGIPEQVFQASGGSMSGTNRQMLLMGNPLRSSGYFYKTFSSEDWTTFKISRLESPRPGGAKYAEEQARDYGIDSNIYRVRVLGEFPRADDNTVIPFELVEPAVYRDVVANPTANVLWGLDVARFGSDSSCLIKRKANIVYQPKVWHNLDLMQLTGAVKAEWDATPDEHKPVEILVDSIGLGAGVCDRLMELKLPARGINVSESPAMGTTYANLRAELWFKCKAWLEKRDCQLPKDNPGEGDSVCARLRNELISVRYKFKSEGKLQIEAKEDMKKRGISSPDVADALILTFASDAGTALYGTSYTSNWQQPLKRGLAIV